MSHRRGAACAVTAMVLGGLVAAPSALASSPRPAAPPIVGHVVYLAKDGVVREAAVGSDGAARTFQTFGPVTVARTGQSVHVVDLLASGNGDWVAWDEQITTHKGQDLAASTLVLRNVVTGTTYHHRSAQTPVGFAGDTLVTTNGDNTKPLTCIRPSTSRRSPTRSFRWAPTGRV
jgi:hypothetical protein